MVFELGQKVRFTERGLRYIKERGLEKFYLGSVFIVEPSFSGAFNIVRRNGGIWTNGRGMIADSLNFSLVVDRIEYETAEMKLP